MVASSQAELHYTMEVARSKHLALLLIMLILMLVVTIGATTPVSTTFSRREKWCDNCTVTTRRGKAPRYSCQDYRSECYQGCRVCSCVLSAEARCTCHDVKDYCDPAQDQQLRT